MEQFSLEKYLENPSRKVVTRDGRKVEILKTNCKSKIPMIVLYDDNDVRWVAANGTIKDNQDTCNDLFFADEEEKLDEFETRIYNLICFSDPDNFPSLEEVKEEAGILLDLARTELEKKYRIVDKDDSDWEDAYKQCKQDALKPLLKWKNVTHDADFCMNARLDEYIINDVLTEHGEVKERWVLKKSDLEKLPKEE